MVDGINPFSSSFAASNNHASYRLGNEFTGAVKESAPFWRGISESQTTHDAGKSVMMWGSREFIGKHVDNITGTSTFKLGAPDTSNGVTKSYFIRKLGFEHADDMVLSDLKSAKGYANKVSSNFKDFNSTFRQSVKTFSPKEYVKTSLWEANSKPIKDMLNKENVGSGFARCVGLGFVGFEIAGAGKEAYQTSKANGDTTMQTAAKTMGAVGTQALKSAISWEAAGLGLAIGRHFLPGIASVPLGGIALGVGASLLSRKAFDKVETTVTGGTAEQQPQQSFDDIKPKGNEKTNSTNRPLSSNLFEMAAMA